MPFQRLMTLMATLRSEHGCPWDREQTHETLKVYLIEESYELYEAIESTRDDLLIEELGDLLLQVVFHSQIASETGRFSLVDVVDGLCEKLIRRHPHVFQQSSGDVDTEDVLHIWERVKREEKEKRGDHHFPSIFDGVPRSLPALMFATKLQRRAAKVGFDWNDPAGAFEKVIEEAQEVLQACREGDRDDLTEEWGDLFFSLVNVARHMGVDPEGATRRAATKFEKRFRRIEKRIAEEGLDINDVTLDEMNSIWEMGKTDER